MAATAAEEKNVDLGMERSDTEDYPSDQSHSSQKELEGKSGRHNPTQLHTKNGSGPAKRNREERDNDNDNDKLRSKKGPYHLQISYKDRNKQISALVVCMFLDGKFPSITSFEIKGKFQVEVTMDDQAEANVLLGDPDLQDKGIQITRRGQNQKLTRKGIIKGIDTMIPDDLISQKIKNDENIRVTEVRRLNRRNKKSQSKDDKWIPSQSIVLTFEGKELPEYVLYFLVQEHKDGW
ncbi:uncharacterized protein LOC111643282 [Copidosoma floridanum]|uniref:uncharacterized protein LOC111643282 n=1 Tax=Copidosoma floridanum TaxID=29053 RepID=UPI000C6F9C16|nr:uncharacterized protein LOC111643282 [Copidosoma floridanum]